MNNGLKMTMPPMAEGQQWWQILLGGGHTRTTYIQRQWHQRAIYTILMYVHDKAEALWHWCYRKAQPFAPIRKMEYVEPKLYGFVGRDGVLRKTDEDT